MDDTVTLWRCSQCGKWSHAARRPRNHERFVSDWGTGPEDEATFLTRNPEHPSIIERQEEESGWDGSTLVRAGWRVRCGPFDEWTARRVPS